MAKRREAAGYLHQSQVLARGAAHLLEVLRLRHPDSDDARLAQRCVLSLEATLTALTAHAAAAADRATEGKGDPP